MFAFNQVFELFITSIKTETTAVPQNPKNTITLSEEDLNRVRTGSSTIHVTISPSEEHYDNVQPQDTELFAFLKEKGLLPVTIITLFSNPLQTLTHADNTPASLNLLTTMLMKDRMNTSVSDQFNFHKGSMVHIWKTLLNEDPCDTELIPDPHEKQIQELEEKKQKILEEKEKKEEAKAQKEAERKASGKPKSVPPTFVNEAKKKELEAEKAQKQADEKAKEAERAKEKVENLEKAAEAKAAKKAKEEAPPCDPSEETPQEVEQGEEQNGQPPAENQNGQPPAENELSPEEAEELDGKLNEPQQTPPAAGNNLKQARLLNKNSLRKASLMARDI